MPSQVVQFLPPLVLTEGSSARLSGPLSSCGNIWKGMRCPSQPPTMSTSEGVIWLSSKAVERNTTWFDSSLVDFWNESDKMRGLLPVLPTVALQLQFSRLETLEWMKVLHYHLLTNHWIFAKLHSCNREFAEKNTTSLWVDSCFIPFKVMCNVSNSSHPVG